MSARTERRIVFVFVLVVIAPPVHATRVNAALFWSPAT
jgi:hypothetical protein